MLERVAHVVYRFMPVPVYEHLDLCAAWLQLAPETPAWECLKAVLAGCGIR